jgi:hypothetical protein
MFHFWCSRRECWGFGGVERRRSSRISNHQCYLLFFFVGDGRAK